MNSTSKPPSQDHRLVQTGDTRVSAKISRETISTLSVTILCLVLLFSARLINPALGSWSQVETVLMKAMQKLLDSSVTFSERLGGEAARNEAEYARANPSVK